MFGLILPHRPVLTPPTQLSDTQLAFPDISAHPLFSHLVVFLLPGTVLPPGAAAAVYLKLPLADAATAPNGGFTLLGALGPGRESAIFRVNLRSSAGGTLAGAGQGSALGAVADDDAMVDDGGAAPNAAAAPTTVAGADQQQQQLQAAGTLTVGLSIEPAAEIEAQLASLKTANPTPGGFNPGGGGALVPARTPVAANNGGAGGVGAMTTKVLAQRIIGNAFNFLASFAGNAGPNGEEVVPLRAFRDWWAKFEKRVELDPGFLEREESG
ncbi:MAG: hypothetical protein M1822_006208 [Bathelium mastoideum]|nr:MAG: hypothetical protein M1822_006208 [Bathelium mastoideum]